jgi:hypothetical protein
MTVLPSHRFPLFRRPLPLVLLSHPWGLARHRRRAVEQDRREPPCTNAQPFAVLLDRFTVLTDGLGQVHRPPSPRLLRRGAAGCVDLVWSVGYLQIPEGFVTDPPIASLASLNAFPKGRLGGLRARGTGAKHRPLQLEGSGAMHPAFPALSWRCGRLLQRPEGPGDGDRYASEP